MSHNQLLRSFEAFLELFQHTGFKYDKLEKILNVIITNDFRVYFENLNIMCNRVASDYVIIRYAELLNIDLEETHDNHNNDCDCLNYLNDDCYNFQFRSKLVRNHCTNFEFKNQVLYQAIGELFELLYCYDSPINIEIGNFYVPDKNSYL
jgi:hypothetical protein